MVLVVLSPCGESGAAVKLTFCKNHKFHFFVIFGFVSWLIKPSKSDFGAPKKSALDGKIGFRNTRGMPKHANC